MKAPIIVRIPLVRAHSIPFRKATENGKEPSKLLHFVYNLESGFSQLWNAQPKDLWMRIEIT